jgi:hypothetical protein
MGKNWAKMSKKNRHVYVIFEKTDSGNPHKYWVCGHSACLSMLFFIYYEKKVYKYI